MLRTIKNISLIVKKSLQHYALSTILTALSIALASGLLMSVFVINSQTYQAFTGGSFGFDAVLGARGSKLQIVLNTIFHLETSPGNIPWSLYEKVRDDKNIDLAIPYVVGDNYKGYRLVGTIPEYFSDFEYQTGKTYSLQKGGRIFNPQKNEVLLGSYVAQQENITIGDTISPYHGTSFTKEKAHQQSYKVTGILNPTNSPIDKVLWIPMDSYFHMDGHVLRGTGQDYQAHAGEDIPNEHKEISAVMLKFKSAQTGITLNRTINREGTTATLAWPIGTVMAKLLNKLGWVNKILTLISYLILLVASISIVSSVYNTIHERRREFAILRALGASKTIVFSSIILECGSIAGLGAVMGYGIYIAILLLSSWIIRMETGVVLNVWQFHPILIVTPICTFFLGAISGILPAIKAYNTDVATNIVPST